MKRILHVGLSTLPNSHSKEMLQAFTAQGWEYKDIAVQHPNLNAEIIRVANEFKPNLTFIQIQDRGIHREAIQALKANNSFVINWSGDLRQRTPDCYFEYAAMGVDLTCFSNMTDIENLRKCGWATDWLQIGASTEIYNTTGPVNSICEIAFMGNVFSHFPLSGLRREMVKDLKRTYGDRFKAFGAGQADGNFMGDQHGEAAVYRGAKIGINLSHFDAPRYTSDRMFRMLLCGTCVLSHIFQENDGYGLGIGWWDSIETLKKQINGLLADEPFRKSIAQAGHELAMSKYTFAKMGENVLELYNKYHK